MSSNREYVEFHQLTKNIATYFQVKSSFRLHYDPHIIQLEVRAPIAIADKPRIALGVPANGPFTDVVLKRRSRREFGKRPIQKGELNNLLFYGNGVVRNSGVDLYYSRNAPNSGNLGSVELFVVAFSVADVSSGLFHYDSVRHELVQLKAGSFENHFREKVLFQPEFTEAGALIILTSAVGRLSQKYGPRGYRLGLLDVGHVSQNINLVATQLGLHVCPTAGFIDDRLAMFVGVDGIDVCPFLVIAVGSAI